jgi:urease accessory protein
MLRLTDVMGADGAARTHGVPSGEARATARTVTLTFEDRRRSRLLVRLDDGTEAALMLPRGTVLREGDMLAQEGGGGALVQVRAAAESLSVARTTEPLRLARGAYHLGNRHVPLQIGPGWVAYQHDHVLDDLARALGLVVTTESGPFEPEAGGYRHQGSEHRHEHTHPHDDDPTHGHGHRH